MDVVQGVHAERQVGNALNSAVVTVRNETNIFQSSTVHIIYLCMLHLHSI